ncbi:MAG: BlaI/MecI/CopY family transcriptional regulator [Planctomycetota bacterium JB042]
MARREQRRPTDAELEILRVLWEGGPSTVREVHRTLEERRGTGYTTVLKLMQIMTEKGLVERDASVRPQVYRASRSARQTQQRLVGDLLDRVFDGSPGELVLRALSSRKTTPEERERIRRMLDDLEESP